MNTLKKFAGIIWILAGPVIIYFLIDTAIKEIGKNPVMATKVQWIVFVVIFTPIAIGLMIFGWYALKDEYYHLPESSKELDA